MMSLKRPAAGNPPGSQAPVATRHRTHDAAPAHLVEQRFAEGRIAAAPFRKSERWIITAGAFGAATLVPVRYDNALGAGVKFDQLVPDQQVLFDICRSDDPKRCAVFAMNVRPFHKLNRYGEPVDKQGDEIR